MAKTVKQQFLRRVLNGRPRYCYDSDEFSPEPGQRLLYSFSPKRPLKNRNLQGKLPMLLFRNPPTGGFPESRKNYGSPITMTSMDDAALSRLVNHLLCALHTQTFCIDAPIAVHSAADSAFLDGNHIVLLTRIATCHTSKLFSHTDTSFTSYNRET